MVAKASACAAICWDGIVAIEPPGTAPFKCSVRFARYLQGSVAEVPFSSASAGSERSTELSSHPPKALPHEINGRRDAGRRAQAGEKNREQIVAIPVERREDRGDD